MLGSIAAAGLIMGAPMVGAGATTNTVVSPPSRGEAPNTKAVAQPGALTPEKQRYRALRGLRLRRRIWWDGKNRSAGDRAHKRMKRRRAAGRA